MVGTGKRLNKETGMYVWEYAHFLAGMILQSHWSECNVSIMYNVCIIIVFMLCVQ